MIRLNNVFASVWEKLILKGVTLDFELGKNYVILWKNGSGKSTLSAVLAGNPRYEVIGGEMSITSPQSSFPVELGTGSSKGGEVMKNLLELSPEERSAEWIFLSFQNIPEIKGIKLIEYLRTIYNIALTSKGPFLQGTGPKWGLSPFLFKRFVKKFLDELKIDEVFLERDLNVGFSGWEKRKIEILQMKLIWPKYIILDEIDSGLDVDAFKVVVNLLKSIDSKTNSLIVITHYFTILDSFDVDVVYVIQDGKVVKSWGKEIVEEVRKKGFGK